MSRDDVTASHAQPTTTANQMPAMPTGPASVIATGAKNPRRMARPQTNDSRAIDVCFRRDIALPLQVQSDRTTASYRDGVLRVELPKAEGVRSRRVDVH